jgi:O-antigen/teichoic acid export membrane protein
MSTLKKLASETALYGLSSILGRLIGYFLVFLHTAVFTRPGELSIQVQLYALAGILNVVYTYGLETAFFRYAGRHPDRRDWYYRLTLTSLIGSSLLFSGALWLAAEPLAETFGAAGQARLVRWLALILATDAIVVIPFARLRLEKRAKKFVGVRLTNIILNVGLNFYFLWFCKGVSEGRFLPALRGTWLTDYDPTLGVGYIFLANLLANLAFFPLLWGEFRDWRPAFDAQQLRELVRYAYPLLIMGLAGTVNLVIDRLLLEPLLPLGFYPGRTAADAVGIYGNCYKLAIFMNLAVQAFRYAADPFFFSKAQDKNAPEVFARVMKAFIIVCVLIWLGVCLNLDWLGQFFLRSPAYREGLVVVPFLLLANLFLGVYYNLSVWFKLTDRTRYGTLLTVIGLGVTLVGNVLLIPLLGYLGCAITFLLSCVVMTAICYQLGEKYYPIPYDLRSAFGYIGSAGVLILGASAVSIQNLWVAVPFHALLFALYLVGVLVVERQYLPARLRQRLRFLP